MVRSSVGRAWMAVRDMDVAAEVIGIRILHTKLLAFAISSFYCGIAGALYAFAYLGTVEPEGFNLDLSFRILFMVIIGGAGSILGLYSAASSSSSWLSSRMGLRGYGRSAKRSCGSGRFPIDSGAELANAV